MSSSFFIASSRGFMSLRASKIFFGIGFENSKKLEKETESTARNDNSEIIEDKKTGNDYSNDGKIILTNNKNKTIFVLWDIQNINFKGPFANI